MSEFFSGGAGTSRTVTGVDPTQATLNDLYAQEALALRGVSGGVPAFGFAQPGLYGLGPTEDVFRRQIISATADPGAYPELLRGLSSRLDRLGQFTGEQMGWAGSPVAGPLDVGALNTFLGALSMGPEALNTFRARTDPTALLSAARRYMTEIGEPAARAASVAGGMGGVRGGAFQEGLARESARLALPIAQLINANLGEYGAAQERYGLAQERYGAAQERIGAGLESRALARRGLAGNLALQESTQGQNLARLLPLLDQHRLAMLTAGQAAAAQPRLLALQDFLRQQDLVMSTLLRTPVRTGGTTTGTATQALTARDFVGPLTTIAAASLLGPSSSSPGILSGLFSGLGGGGGGVLDLSGFLGPSWT